MGGDIHDYNVSENLYQKPSGKRTTAGIWHPVQYRWTPIIDQKVQQDFGAKNIDVNWASVVDGLVTVGNYAMDNGQFREWQTKVMMSACPVLNDFMNHCIIDTSQAG